MSRFAELLAPSLPAGLRIPEPLDRAWAWMESQGWLREIRGGQYLTPYAGIAELGIVFSPQETLAGWFEPGETGHDRLVPLGQTDGTGSFAVLWLDPSDTVRFALLGSEGERLYLADDAVDFLRLLAIGYLELHEYSLDEEPVEDDEESVAALAEFRAWVTAEFGVQVPAQWSTRDPDPFGDWVAEVRQEEPVPARTFGDGPVFDGPEVSPADVVAACEELMARPFVEGIDFGRQHGIPLISAPWGHELKLVQASAAFRPEHAPLVADRMEAVRAAFVERWGAPRTRSAKSRFDGGTWVENRLDTDKIAQAELWDVAGGLVVVLITSAEEGSQLAAVISTAADTEAPSPW